MISGYVKIRVCLPRKYGRFMLFIDNNLLLPGARLHILNNKGRSPSNGKLSDFPFYIDS